ncbi:MAG TPA: AgmX/PglI C-terminal domain-containing protein, partial [Myxococcota bacterium]|nr:AgmX/PglI C-terminal domain-containing protein [Myxococcota bacterium]
RGLKEVPGNAGRLVLKWTIAADGQVSNAVIKSTTLNNPTTEACILQVVQQMTFPKPDSGVVIVSYPFSFSP